MLKAIHFKFSIYTRTIHTTCLDRQREQPLLRLTSLQSLETSFQVDPDEAVITRYTCTHRTYLQEIASCHKNDSERIAIEYMQSRADTVARSCSPILKVKEKAANMLCYTIYMIESMNHTIYHTGLDLKNGSHPKTTCTLLCLS